MKLTSKTQLQTNIEAVESATNTVALATASAVHALNNSHSLFWSLPDDELVTLLQFLLDEDKLDQVFTKHFVTATSLNQILDDADYEGVRAIATVGREFEIDQFGIITLVIPVVEEPVTEEPIVEELVIEEPV